MIKRIIPAALAAAATAAALALSMPGTGAASTSSLAPVPRAGTIVTHETAGYLLGGGYHFKYITGTVTVKQCLPEQLLRAGATVQLMGSNDNPYGATISVTCYGPETASATVSYSDYFSGLLNWIPLLHPARPWVTR
jgi:hypothetical protein